MNFTIAVTTPEHEIYAEAINNLIKESAKARGTGIAERKIEYIQKKINMGNSVIALDGDKLAGFCYIETWGHGQYVVNSGLIVAPEYRRFGLATLIKERVFQLSREKYPAARIFGITTSLAVMKINSALGYEPVTFSELTQDPEFWSGCKSCPNFDILERNQRRMCLCTAMLAPSQQEVDAMKHDLTNLIVTANVK
jgi:GNAT superfamily N-acetyltransferase